MKLQLSNKFLDVYIGQDVSMKRARNVAQIKGMEQKYNLFISQKLKLNEKTSISRTQKENR